MANFVQHVAQARHNLSLLQILFPHTKYYDWQVTVCYYTAVHLVNAHLAKTGNTHFQNHSETKNAINYKGTSISSIGETPFKHYVSLENLSRRARYLSHQSKGNHPGRAFATEPYHLANALFKLENLMLYFGEKYAIQFSEMEVTCPEVKAELKNSLKYFVF